MAPWGPRCQDTCARTCVCGDSPGELKAVDKDVCRSSEGEAEGEEPPGTALIPLQPFPLTGGQVKVLF